MDTGVKFKNTQIARKFNISDKTAKKYMNMDVQQFKEYQKKSAQRKQKSKLDPYKNFITELYEEFPEFTAAQVYDHLLEAFGKEFPVKYGTVKIFVRKHKEILGAITPRYQRQYQAIPELPYGLQAQVDLGEIYVKNEEGLSIKLYVCCMVLCRSRYKFGTWSDKPFKMKDFLNFHYKSFSFFHGVPKEIYYDRTKLAIVDEVQDEKYKLPEEFMLMTTTYSFSPKYCKSYDPESKGKVESVVKYAKYNFAKGRVFKNIDDWQRRFENWLDRTGNGKIHDIIKKVPAEEFVLEKPTLQPTPATNINSIPYSLRKDNTVMYKGNRYAVPKGTFSQDKKVLLVDTENKLTIAEITGIFLAEHEIPITKGNLIMGKIEKVHQLSVLELKLKALELLGNSSNAGYWLNSLIDLHPKNQRKYFNKILKTFKSLDKDRLQEALKYCLENKKWDSDDILAIIDHLSEEKLRVERPFNAITLKTDPVVVPVRDIKEYDVLYGGKKNAIKR